MVHVVTTGLEIFKTKVWMNGRRERMNSRLIGWNELSSYFVRQYKSYFLLSMRRIWTYSRSTSRKSLSFWLTTFSTSLTNLTAPLPKHDDCKCYINRRVHAPPKLWVQENTDIRDFAHSAGLWHHPKLGNIPCAWSWTLCDINPAMQVEHSLQIECL